MAIEFPRRLLREQNHDWNIVGNTAGAGQTATASVDVRSDGGGLWMASLNSIRFLDATDTRLWRAMRQICNGGITPLVVPRNDIAFVPWPSTVIDGVSVPHMDGALFNDGAGYYQPIIDVKALGAAALRATAMNWTLTYCGALLGGEVFSIEHPTFGWRMYEVATVVVASGGATAAVTFNPPLREAVVDGTRIELDRPRCLMKLASPGAMDLNVTTWPFSLASVKFVESKYAA